MKNYKIVDTRPELSTEQIIQGMNFKKIKVNAGIAKATALKSLIIKGFLGIVLVSSGVVVYKNYKLVPAKNEQSAITETTTKAVSKENESVNIPTIVVSEKTPENNVTHKTVAISSSSVNKDTIIKDLATLQIPEKDLANSVTSANADDSASVKKEENIKKGAYYALNKYAKCKLWSPVRYCDIPKKAKLSNSFDTDAADFDYISCQEATKNKLNMKAVWVTINTKGKSNLQLESQLKNITLIRASNGELLHPLMIAVMADGSKFFGKQIKVKKLVAHYDGQVDFFIFFSEADIGDTVIVKNFVEAIIQE